MLAEADASLFSTTNVMTDPSASMTQSEKNVLLELEKILQTCIQINKILVQAVELAKGPHTAEQKKALEGMNVWKRVIDENKETESISDDEMEIDT